MPFNPDAPAFVPRLVPEEEAIVTPKPVEETTPPEPEEPVDYWGWSEDEEDEKKKTIKVFNFRWSSGGNDVYSNLSFTLPHYRDKEVDEEVKVKSGQFLLITWCCGSDSAYSSGWHSASLTVLDEEPDLDDKEKYPDENWAGAFEYEVKSHEALQREIL